MNYTTAKASIILLAAIAMLESGCANFEETVSRANEGDSTAQYSLYEAYSSGDFKGQKVEKNRQLALDYLAKAAKSDGGNKKYRQELLNCYMRDGRLDKMDEIIADYSNTFEPKWSWSEAASLIDMSDFKESAPQYVNAILRQRYSTLAEAKKVFAQADKFNEFAKGTLCAVDTYNYGVLDESAAKKGDTNYQIERRNAHGRASELGLLKGDYKLTLSSFNCLADIHNAIVGAKNKYGEALEEAKRKEEERRVAEEKRREEEARIAHEKAEKEAEERKMQEKEEARIAHEKAEKDWEEKKNDADYKFPLHKDYPNQTALYKEIKTGVSLEWLAMFLSHGDFTNVQIRASSQESYLTPTNVAFFDADRRISLDFGKISAESSPVLISGRIEFSKGDVSEEALLQRYKKEFPDATIDQQERITTEGGGALFGIPLPKITSRKLYSGYTTPHSIVVIETLKGVMVDMKNISPSTGIASSGGTHHIGEDGQYEGPASGSMANALVHGVGYEESEADLHFSVKALEVWAQENEKCNIPSVTVLDIPLQNATQKALEDVNRLKEEKEKRAAEEVEKKRRAAEEARANDF